MDDNDERDALPNALRHQAEVAHQALHELLRQALRLYSANPLEPLSGELKLDWSSSMSMEDLAQQVLQRVKLSEASRAVIQPGRVYCYNCASSSCEHAQPPTPGQVFAGYANTGRPRWEELHNELVSLGDDRVAQLFDSRPRLLASILGRKRIIAEQTVAYGRNSMLYRIIAQLVSGYVMLDGIRHAFTVQIVETADRSLHVQTLMDDRLRVGLADATPASHAACYRINDAISKLRRDVRNLVGEWQNSRTRAQRKQQQELLFGMLLHLTNSIEQKGRQARRRTTHAEERSQDKRPVHKAAQDVVDAQPHDFYRDTVRESNVVVGKNGRCHVFSDRGKHITSLLLTGDKLERRKRTNRYVRLESSAVQELRPLMLDHVNDIEVDST